MARQAAEDFVALGRGQAQHQALDRLDQVV
jgi:hypothetical protein